MTRKRKTQQKRKQNALQDIVSDKDSGGGCGERGGGSRRDTVLPPIDSSQTPIPAEGTPSTTVSKTRESIIREMRDRFDAWWRGDIELDDGEFDFITNTIGTPHYEDENLPSLTENADEMSPDTLIGGVPNISIPTTPPQNTHFAQTHHGFHSGDGNTQPARMYTGFHFGGYDGQTAIGIEGRWMVGRLEKICQFLEGAKELAGERPDGMIEGGLCGYDVLVSASGAKEGLLYKYRVIVDGVTILLHHNPPKGRQAARVRFSAETLMRNIAPAVWQRVLEFFDAVGFVVTKAVPSRVDLQVTTDFSMSELYELIKNKHVVSKLRKQAVIGGDVFNGDVETIEYGAGGSDVQIKFYNKLAELLSKKTCLTQKYVLTQEKIGDDWRNSGRPVTRVEISITRDGLRNMGYHTVEDLFGNEWAIINLITHNWFRITAEPKIKGNEHKQKNHPLWDRIRSLFRLYFPDGYDEAKAEWKPPAPAVCDPVALKKQALGCLSKAFAASNGHDEDMDDTVMLGNVWIDEVAPWLHYKRNLTAFHMEIKSGVPLKNWTKGWTKEDHQADREERYFMRNPLWSPEKTIDQDVLDRAKKRALDAIMSPSGVTDAPHESPPIRGNGAAVELTATTGLGRFKESMEIIKQNVRLRQLE